MRACLAFLMLMMISCTPKGESQKTARIPAAQVDSPQVNECEHDAKNFRCVKYIRNYDADTITVQIPGVHPLIGERISVRVLGVDSAEMRSKDACERERAREAKKLVERTLKKARRIDLKNVQRDKYFRILADVSADGQDLKKILFDHNLVYEYHGATKQKIDWCLMGNGKSVLEEF